MAKKNRSEKNKRFNYIGTKIIGIPKIWISKKTFTKLLIPSNKAGKKDWKSVKKSWNIKWIKEWQKPLLNPLLNSIKLFLQV